MTKQVHIHIHRTKARDAGEGEGKWITLSPSGTHVKIDKGGEITAGPKGMTGKKPSELSSKSSAPARAQERTPMRQEMRNLQAAGLKEARKLTRTPAQPGMERSINRLQAEADIKEAKERVYARRSESRSKDPDTGFVVHKNTRFDPKTPPLKGSAGPATTKTESYSWGKLTKVGNVNESAIAHPKDREQIAALADGDSYQYTDEQGKQWKVTRHGEQAAFYKANAANPALVAPIGEFQDTPHDPTGMAHAGRPQGTAAVQARIDAKKAAGKPVGFAGKAAAPDLTKHSQFTKADYDYLKEKGWSDPEIKKRWDEEAAQGRPPQQANKLKPPSAFGPASGEGPRGASRSDEHAPLRDVLQELHEDGAGQDAARLQKALANERQGVAITSAQSIAIAKAYERASHLAYERGDQKAFNQYQEIASRYRRANADIPQGTAAVQARIDAKKAAAQRRAEREHADFLWRQQQKHAPSPSSGEVVRLGNQAPVGGVSVSSGKPKGSVR